MRWDFIYFKEVVLNDNNKFILYFPDEEFIQEIYFIPQKSGFLIEKVAAYQNDIGYLISKISRL